MDSPLHHFVTQYADSGILRLHMPGHKGIGPLGIEALDITEVHGADSLYEADGIIAHSEENASRLFDCPTFYSAEGSSLCIRAMLYLTVLYARAQGKRPLVAAGRNAHKTFLSAAALLDFDLTWLWPENESSYLACPIRAEALDQQLSDMAEPPTAVYITSPDYLGNTANITALAKVCHRHGALLLVDNAHGAYLRFLTPSRHPIDLGADLCCDSAHKTLPVLTGGAYLHIRSNAPALFTKEAKNALALFGSTSPSYLILQSLDRANEYLAGSYREQLAAFVAKIAGLKSILISHGYTLRGDEPLKLTIAPKTYGYTGTDLAQSLREQCVECEFADPDFVVFMVTPETGAAGLERLKNALLSLPAKSPIPVSPPRFTRPEPILTVRQAAFAPRETLPIEKCVARVFASATMGCPPAVPIVVYGERIDHSAVECFSYYGITHCSVVTEE